MTSNLAAIEPPLSTSNCSFSSPPTRIGSHDLQQTPKSWPRQSVNLIPNAPARFQDTSEPALKRQKIGDSDTDLIGKTGGFVSSIVDNSHATKYKALVNSTDLLSDSINGEQDPQTSLLPVRPGRTPQLRGHQQDHALALERANVKDIVPVKFYVPEPPSFVPKFHDAGKRRHLLQKSYHMTHRS